LVIDEAIVDGLGEEVELIIDEAVGDDLGED